MNVPVDVSEPQTAALAVADSSESVSSPQVQTTEDRLCWLEVRQYCYQPDHQVELLHLQAEADALLLQLKTLSQRRRGAASEG